MILLSAGHYPESPGACSFGWCEHEEALKWINIIAYFIREQNHVDTVPTGKLPSKVKWINEYHLEKVKLAVEIHFNSDFQHSQSGFETLYCPGSVKGKEAAQIVNDSLIGIFKKNRGIKEGWYKMDRPGVEDYPGDIEGDEKPDYFLKETNPVAIILEPEFIHNRTIIETNRDAACKALAGGILKAMENL